MGSCLDTPSSNQNMVVFLFQADDFGVCFDIDGVISRGHVPFPEARTAYQLLMDHDRNIHIPSCFVTNSLGRNSCRAMQLTEWLGVTVCLTHFTLVYPWLIYSSS